MKRLSFFLGIIGAKDLVFKFRILTKVFENNRGIAKSYSENRKYPRN